MAPSRGWIRSSVKAVQLHRYYPRVWYSDRRSNRTANSVRETLHAWLQEQPQMATRKKKKNVKSPLKSHKNSEFDCVLLALTTGGVEFIQRHRLFYSYFPHWRTGPDTNSVKIADKS